MKVIDKEQVVIFQHGASEELKKEVVVLETERLYVIFRAKRQTEEHFIQQKGFCRCDAYFCRKSDEGRYARLIEVEDVYSRYGFAGRIAFKNVSGIDNPYSDLVIETDHSCRNQGLMREAMNSMLGYLYENDILKLDNGKEVELKSKILKGERTSLAFHRDFGFKECDKSPRDRKDCKITKDIFNDPEKKENRERKIQDKINAERNLKISSISSEIKPPENTV